MPGVADDTWPGRPYVVAIEVTGDEADAEFNEDAVREIVMRSLGPACRPGAEPDKCLTVTLEGRGATCDVTVQEYDVWLHRSGEPFRESNVDPRLLDAVIARLARDAFRVRSHIQRVNDDYVASVWGGRLDRALLFAEDTNASESAWCRAYLRFRDRDGAWRQTQDVAWTFLRLRRPNANEAELSLAVDVESAFPQPLPGRLRRGEIVALTVRPSQEQTTYIFEDHRLGTPRGGLWVEITPARLTEVASASTEPADGETDRVAKVAPLESQIDRTGRLTLTGDEVGDAPVRLRVRSSAILVDAPIMVGATARQVVAVPEDRERVELAEDLKRIEATLQDVVARRAVVLSRIQSAIEDSSWTNVEPLLDELKKLPDGSELRQELNAARVNAVAKARRRGDGGSISRINRECARLERTLTSFVAPDVDDELRAEAEALKEIQEAAKMARPEVIERQPTDSVGTTNDP